MGTLRIQNVDIFELKLLQFVENYAEKYNETHKIKQTKGRDSAIGFALQNEKQYEQSKSCIMLKNMQDLKNLEKQKILQNAKKSMWNA